VNARPVLGSIDRHRKWWKSGRPGSACRSPFTVGFVASYSEYGDAIDGPLPVHVVAALLVASVGFSLILDRIKRPVEAAFNVT